MPECLFTDRIYGVWIYVALSLFFLIPVTINGRMCPPRMRKMASHGNSLNPKSKDVKVALSLRCPKIVSKLSITF